MRNSSGRETDAWACSNGHPTLLHTIKALRSIQCNWVIALLGTVIANASNALSCLAHEFSLFLTLPGMLPWSWAAYPVQHPKVGCELYQVVLLWLLQACAEPQAGHPPQPDAMQVYHILGTERTRRNMLYQTWAREQPANMWSYRVFPQFPFCSYLLFLVFKSELLGKDCFLLLSVRALAWWHLLTGTCSPGLLGTAVVRVKHYTNIEPGCSREGAMPQSHLAPDTSRNIPNTSMLGLLSLSSCLERWLIPAGTSAIQTMWSGLSYVPYLCKGLWKGTTGCNSPGTQLSISLCVSDAPWQSCPPTPPSPWGAEPTDPGCAAPNLTQGNPTFVCKL